MKTLRDLENMLFREYWSIKSGEINLREQYLNQYLGDTSVLVTSILEEWLLDRHDWDSKKWIDDALLTKVDITNNGFCLWGIMIWGRENTLEQWTDAFFFHGTIDELKQEFSGYTILFAEEGEDVPYLEFTSDRGMWDRDFYSDENWDPSERNWKYGIKYN